jgi:GntR family carbon starvation induced transcriptional regulator
MWFKPLLDGIATGAAMSSDISETQKITLASAIYEKLRDDIITGSQPPTHKLHIRKLCDRFSVGLSPMREALSRLSSEGLIKQTDRRGFSVAPVSLPELLDLTRARCWINEIGLRESIARGDQAWEEAVVLSFYRMQRTPRVVADTATDRNPEWETAHREFHLSLVSGCGSDWIVGICDKLFDAAERYRHWARRAGVVRSSAAEEEHRAIMEAVVKRDSAAAIALLNAHFQRTAELVERVVAAGGAKQTGKKTASRPAAQSKVKQQEKRRTKD